MSEAHVKAAYRSRWAVTRRERALGLARSLVASDRPPGALTGCRNQASYIGGMEHARQLRSLSDDDLLRRLADLVGRSRRVEADLVAHVAEVDARRLYRREAASSMHVYCVEVLHLSDAEAYLRIAVARASRAHPGLLTMLADGRLHLSGIERLAPHLTPENRNRLLERATHKTKREIELLVAELAPRPDVSASIRKLPQLAERTGASQAGTERASANAGSTPLELRPDGVTEGSAPTTPSGLPRGDYPTFSAAPQTGSIPADRSESLGLTGLPGPMTVTMVLRWQARTSRPL